MVVAGGLGMLITGSIAEVTPNPRPVFWVGLAAAVVAAQAVDAALKLTGSVASRRARYRLRNLVERFAKYDALSAREARDGIRQFLVRGPLSA